ncbi:DUF2125 domain-containing protein [Yoonia sp. BS5-3]|uniref:DUF2125 domain-containing protein n=1 Tax=Yoonia phaeophyticola TaxID=3137369 RepID=A0ABZ2V481_9RHOB
MRRLMFWLLFLALLFSGYWFAAAKGAQEGLRQALEQIRRDGWQVETGAMGVTGFPGQFSLDITGLSVAAPDGFWAWNGPDLQLAAPSIKPTQLSLSLPETQTLRIGGQNIEIAATTLQLNAATRMNMAASFDAASVLMEDALLRSDQGWDMQLASGDVALTAVEEEAQTYGLDVAIADLVLPADLVRQIGLSDQISSLTTDAQLSFDRPLDRFALEGTPPAVTTLDLRSLNVVWGDITLGAAGLLDIDAQGIPEGQIIFETAEWRRLIDLLVDTGAVDAGNAATVRTMAGAMAGSDGVLQLPLTFRDGFMSMGLLPLGPAPVLR